MTQPTRQELVTATLGSLAFTALGAAMLLFATLPLFMQIVAWAALIFGGIGFAGVVFRLSGGRNLGPNAETLDRWAAEKAARRAKAKPFAAVHHKGPLPQLSANRQAQVRKAVRLMAEHGLFVPEVPDSALLYAGVAERDEPVKPDIVLDALGEVEYYHPGTDVRRWLGNLEMHYSHGEQDEEAQIAAIARLAGGALDVRDVSVRYGDVPEHPRLRQVDLAMTINDERVTLNYAGHAKYLSTLVHRAMAERLYAGGSGKRLAALWVADQGVWLSVLADGAVDALNADLKLGARSGQAWSWVDEEEGFAAGADLIRANLA